ncbi:MAG TPA: hypothetical protein VMU50_05370 [Polyangia bacterium]|nr:hypothetical protein [Polyangia bacterium]
MRQRTVVVAPRLMDPMLLQMTREACALAGADCHDWAAPARLDALTGSAALALGVLPAGARRIPGDLAAVVTEQLPGLPLLLVAEEPLVRPVISMQDGRVTLLEAPSSAARLASCLRALLAEATPSPADQSGWWRAVDPGAVAVAGAATATSPTTVARREYRKGRCWIGVLERGGAGERRAADPAAEPGPAAWLRTSAAVAAVITTSPGAPPPEADDQAGAPLMIQLDVSAERSDWILRPPRAGGALVLFSAQRFPAFSDLGRPSASNDNGVRRLAAAAGDIVVALMPGDVVPDLGDVLAALGTEAGASGAPLLDALEPRVRDAAGPSCCVVIEAQ